MGRVTVTSRIVPWSNKEALRIDKGVLQLATVIHRNAGILAPKLTRALVKSGRIERNGSANYSVWFGSPRVPYARRRHFENRRHPQTLEYLKRAGDAEVRNVSKYL